MKMPSLNDPIALPAASFIFSDLSARIITALPIDDAYRYNRVWGAVGDAIIFAHGLVPPPPVSTFFGSASQHWGDATPVFGKVL